MGEVLLDRAEGGQTRGGDRDAEDKGWTMYRLVEKWRN